MTRTVIGLLAILAWLPVTEVDAQTVERASFTPVGWVQELPQENTGGPSTLSRIASAVGGALLGAGLGFFASQIVQGDWQDAGATNPIDRTMWAVVGGSVGLTAGLRFPVGGRGTLGGRRLPTGRDHIGPDELEGLGFDNAFGAVEALRPEWLRVRGPRSLAPSVDPVTVTGTGAGTSATGSTALISETETIQIYVDGVAMGGLATLNSIHKAVIRDIYWFDAGAATARFGRANPHGAILVTTTGGRTSPPR